MSRSQGAANNGWPAQRHPAGEPDPRTGGRPAQRPQTPQQAPQYAVPGQPAAGGYPAQPGYDPQQGQQPGYAAQPPQAYHYPQQQPQQYAPPQAPAAPGNRQALSSLESARNAQPTHDFENYPRTQPPQYAPQVAQPAPRHPQPGGYAAPRPDTNPIHAATGYRQPQQAAPQYGQPQHAAPQYAPREPVANGYEQWPPAQPAHDPYGQELGGYHPNDTGFPANSNQPYTDPLQQADWAMPAAGYGDPALEQQGYARYDQPQAGALEPTYNQEEAGGYEIEEPRRGSWTMRIAGAVVVAIGLGYGLAQAYKAVLGSPPDSTPPVIASDSSPAKERPTDPGGKQFSHPDSKVLGRLGESDAPGGEADSSLAESDASNGSRKVATLVIGRDGSIAPPAAEAASAPAEDAVSVPGLTVVDAFGSAATAAPPPARQREPEPQAEAEPVVVNVPDRPRVNVKSTRVIPATTASIDDPAPAVVVPKKQKVAVAAPAAGEEAATSGGGANGYVVVLASVPASGNSRLDALRKFADMQQQYGAVLANKTPDVRETTLAGKGAYHRLLVGPPSSRSQANELCIQLKASGYKDCWVTAY